MYRIYQYYLDGVLYAYTDNKKYKKMFESTRNMKLFRKDVYEYNDKEDLDIAINGLPANYKLIEDVLTDGTAEAYTIICTIKESAQLDDITTNLYNIRDYAYHVGVNYESYPSVIGNGSNEKYLKKISKLMKKLDMLNAEVNTLKLFYNLNKKTFNNDKRKEAQRI